MCLDQITKTGVVEEEDAIIAYKVFYRCRFTGYLKGVIYNTKESYIPNKKYVSYPRTAISRDNQNNPILYKTGFHAFFSMPYASKYMTLLNGTVNLEIHKVKIWGNISYGRQRGMRSLSGEFMEISEDE